MIPELITKFAFVKSPHAFSAFSFLFLLVIVTAHATGQSSSRQALEQDKREIEQEIRMINQMLQETKKTAEVNLGQLVMLNNQITRRESLVRSLNSEIELISKRITAFSGTINELEQELEDLRSSYAAMIQHAYRNRNSYQRLMFLFSSRDFNQAWLRMKYLQQLARHRRQQGLKIEETRQSLHQKISELEQQKSEQQVLLAEQRAAMQSLSREKAEQNNTVTRLRRREQDLTQRLRQQEKAAAELEKAIQEVIAEEIRRAREAAREQGRATPEMFGLTPEEQLLSDNFMGNKGKLPWPLERGIITGQFGEQPHPVLPGIKVSNNGIDISTTHGAKARAIFEGTVTRIVSIPGSYYAVIVRHGEYLTVYSNLSEVFVRSGQQISLRQELGVVATDRRDSKTHMNLQIWHGNNKLNPAEWIARQR